VLTVSYSGFVGSETASSLTTAPTASTTATTATGAGTTAIIASGGVSNNYDFAYVAGTLTINKATLTVTADNKSKVYGATNPVLTVSYSGFVGSETASSLTTAPTASTTATTATGAGTTAITAAGGVSDNYNFVYTAGTLAIGKATLTVTAPNRIKVYGTANPQFQINNVTGFIGTDNPSNSLSTVPTASTTATTASVAGVYPITVSGGVSSNYDFVYVAGTLTIVKATLTVTADIKTKVYGAANPALTVTYSGFRLSDAASSLTTEPTATTIATTTSVVGTYAITAAGGVSDNYNFDYTAGSLIIGKATLTVTADNKSKVYGAANPALTVSYSGFTGSDAASSLTTAPTATTIATTTSGAGTYDITTSGGVSDNYDFVYVAGVLTVTKATLTITADNKTKVYGAANPVFTVTYTGFVGSDDETSLINYSKESTPATLVSVVGNYPITESGAVSDNYDFVYVAGTLTITKATLTVTADNKTKVYGAANPALTVTYSGFVLNDAASNLTTAPTASTTATTTSVVGTYGITASGGVSSNYDFVYVAGALTITKATLTVTADNKTKVYGAANPALTVTYSGFKGTDAATSLSTAPTASTTATTTSGVGIYAITASGGVSSNYDFVYVAGTLTITKATLTVTAEDKTKVYGSSNPALTVTYSGFKGTDAATSLSTVPTASTTATTTSGVGTYAITASGGVSSNYDFVYVAGTLTITKATLTVTADNKTKVYGSSNPALTVTYSGFKGTDAATSLSTVPTASTTATTTSGVGTYAITASGGVSSNYDFVYVAGTLTITKATLTVTAQDASRCFGLIDPTLTYIVTGYLNGDAATSITTKPIVVSNTTASSVAGIYKTIASGAVAANYNFVYVDGKFTVNALPIGTVSSTVDFVCDGSTLTLNATGGATYVWYKAGVVIPSATSSSVVINSSGDYNAKLISSFGCEAMSSNSLTIKQYYAPVADFITQYYCINKPVNITNKSTSTTAGTVKYLWDDGAGNTSALLNPVFTYNTTGNKTIKLSVIPDNCPALKNDISKVVAIESPTAAIRMPIVDVQAFETVTLQARTSFGVSYEWSPTVYWSTSYLIANPTVMLDKETLFNIKITAASSCVTVDTLQVRIFKKKTVYVPNTFTPNGDGVNDVFRINPVGIRDLRYFRIYNQWGTLVFETSNLSVGWDGNFKGVKQPLATYTWVIDAVDINAQPIRESGSITLIR